MSDSVPFFPRWPPVATAGGGSTIPGSLMGHGGEVGTGTAVHLLHHSHSHSSKQYKHTETFYYPPSIPHLIAAMFYAQMPTQIWPATDNLPLSTFQDDR